MWCYYFLMPVGDTTPEARAVQDALYRSMTGEQRLILAFEMCEAARELNRERLRIEHPEWSQTQIDHEILRLAFFPEPLPAGFK